MLHFRHGKRKSMGKLKAAAPQMGPPGGRYRAGLPAPRYQSHPPAPRVTPPLSSVRCCCALPLPAACSAACSAACLPLHQQSNCLFSLVCTDFELPMPHDRLFSGAGEFTLTDCASLRLLPTDCQPPQCMTCRFTMSLSALGPSPQGAPQRQPSPV